MLGTRPEAIKLLPCYLALKERGVQTALCTTGQHREMVEEVFQLFGVHADVDLQIMRPDQDLFTITEAVLAKLKPVLEKMAPSCLLVQGDTTSAFAAALAAFYLKIPVAHVEAGLRTHNRYRPFPEELNRQLLSKLATLHFAPTERAASELKKEGISSEKIFCVGNTVVDALFAIQDKLKKGEVRPSKRIQNLVAEIQKRGRKALLLTAHRRESLQDGGMQRIFCAVQRALALHPEIEILFPMHPNPKILLIATECGLQQTPRLHILPPAAYHDMVFLLSSCTGVLTDSGGIQEESASLGLPALVLREETERLEGVEMGCSVVVGTEEEKLLKTLPWLLDYRGHSAQGGQSYGDGHAAERIASLIQERFFAFLPR